jgi:hypothetical protein
LNALDAKPLAKATLPLKILYELSDRQEEECLLLSTQTIEVFTEPSQPRVRWQRFSQLLRPTRRFLSLVKRAQQLFARGENADALSGTIDVGIALASLPIGRPEPRLSGIDQFLWSQEDSFGRDLGIQEITLLQMRGAAHVVRKCDLTSGSHGGS